MELQASTASASVVKCSFLEVYCNSGNTFLTSLLLLLGRWSSCTDTYIHGYKAYRVMRWRWRFQCRPPGRQFSFFLFAVVVLHTHFPQGVTSQRLCMVHKVCGKTEWYSVTAAFLIPRDYMRSSVCVCSLGDCHTMELSVIFLGLIFPLVYYYTLLLHAKIY